MTSPDKYRRVEVKDGDQAVAVAEMTTAERAEGTVRTSLLQDSARLEATVPLGDARIAGAAAGAGRGHRHRPGRAGRPGGCGHPARQPGGGQRTAWRRAIRLVIAAR